MLASSRNVGSTTNLTFTPVKVRRFSNHAMNVDTPEGDDLLQSALSILATYSRRHFQTKAGFYNRVCVCIKHPDDTFDLFLAASKREGRFECTHAEEQLAEDVLKKYIDNKNIVTIERTKTGEKIYCLNIEWGFSDIQPCDGICYGKNHHCHQFFTDKGRKIQFGEDRVRVKIKPRDNFYWNAALPAQKQQTQVRSEELERDETILGIDLTQMHRNVDLLVSPWNKCYVAGEEIKEIDLKQLFAWQREEMQVTPPMQKLIDLWEDALRNNLSTSFHLLQLLREQDNQWPWLQCIRAIVNNWTLPILIKLDFNLEQINAIRDIQSWYLKIIRESTIERALETENISCKNTMKNTQLSNELTKIILHRNPPVFRNYLNKLKNTLPQDHYYSFLLFSRNGAGYKILNSLLMQAATEELLIYWIEINEGIKKQFIRKEFLNRLLLDKTNSFNLMHHVLLAGNTENAELCFRILEDAHVKKIINDNEYKELLISKNDDDFTPLHQTLMSCNSEVTARYLKSLEDAYSKEIISGPEYNGVLTNVTASGFNPLLTAVMKKNIDSLLHYLKIVKKYNNIIIQPTAYKQLIMPKTDSTLWIIALTTSNLEIMVVCMNLLEEAFNNEILNEDEYNHILTAPDLNNRNPLHYSVVSKNAKIVAFYLAVLDEIHNNKRTTTVDYKTLMITPSINKGFTPFLQALGINNLEIVQLCLKVMETKCNLTTEEYRTLCTYPNIAGFSGLNEVLIAGNVEVMQLYLHILETKCELSAEDYKVLCTRPTNQEVSFTAMQQALLSGNLEMLDLYLHILETKCELSTEDYKALCTRPNEELSFTAMQQALLSGNLGIVIAYLDILETKCNLSAEDYKTLCTYRGRAGFTPLMESIGTANLKILLLFLEVLEKKCNLSAEDYKRLFVTTSDAGSNPMQQAFRTKNLDIVMLCLDILETKCSLNPEDYTNLFIASNKAGYTALHQALLSGNLQILELYLETITNKCALSDEDYKNLMTCQYCSGFNAMDTAVSLGNLPILKRLIGFIQTTLPNQQKDILFTFLKDTKKGKLRSHPVSKKRAAQIAAYLDNLRFEYGVFERNFPAQRVHLSRSSLFEPHQPARKRTKIEFEPKPSSLKRLREYEGSETSKSTSVYHKRLRTNDATYAEFGAEEAHPALLRQSREAKWQHDSEESEDRIPSFPHRQSREKKHYDEGAGPSHATRLSTPSSLLFPSRTSSKDLLEKIMSTLRQASPSKQVFHLKLNDQDYDFNLKWINATTEYTTYSVLYNQGEKKGNAYFVISNNDKKTHYNFNEFRKNEINSLFIGCFIAPEGSTIHLPKHMQCFILPQKRSTKVSSKPTEIISAESGHKMTLTI